MLQEPNLDNQAFDEIIEAALAKLPHANAEWTDYNAHDPGVTMLELFAWYKQYQQYHLNLLTDNNIRAFLRLLGIRPGGVAQASACAVPMLGEKRLLPAGMPVYSGGGERLELVQSAVAGDVLISQIVLARQDAMLDVTELLTQQAMPVTLHQGDALYIGFEKAERDVFGLWFSLSDAYPVGRNALAGESIYTPRDIAVTFPLWNEPEAGVVMDQTHALAFEGEMTLKRPVQWEKSDAQRSLDDAYWLVLELTDAGCEEPLSLTGVFPTPLQVEQTHTLCEEHLLLLPGGRENGAVLCSRLAAEGVMNVLARDEGGWYEVSGVSRALEMRDGCRLCMLALPAMSLQEDGRPNVRVAFAEEGYALHTKRASSGMPGMRLPVYARGGEPVKLSLLCRSVLSDGRERYQEWCMVDTLEGQGETGRTFAYDPAGEELCFGDNQNGAVPLKGASAIRITALALTRGKAGAPLMHDDLFFAELYDDEGPHARIAKVTPGRDRESVAQARQRLGIGLRTPQRAVTAEDYASIAMRTPGLRVMAAKALPLYNGAGAPGQVEAAVSVVVLPYSEDARPMPNARFLAAVQAHMQRYRPVCTEVAVLAPVYAPLTITAEVVAAGRADKAYEQVAAALAAYFEAKRYIYHIGVPLLLSSVIERIGEARDILAVRNASVSVRGVQYSRTRRGDVILPKHAIPYLDTLELRAVAQSVGG